ncbi:hypothetical protein BJ742DRAFT_770148 [Cladochytrium replicatum]|nr:hypothetical protein BJ742DRAFT_770148 [Cladochytrium replicatum]
MYHKQEAHESDDEFKSFTPQMQAQDEADIRELIDDEEMNSIGEAEEAGRRDDGATMQFFECFEVACDEKDGFLSDDDTVQADSGEESPTPLIDEPLEQDMTMDEPILQLRL